MREKKIRLVAAVALSLAGIFLLSFCKNKAGNANGVKASQNFFEFANGDWIKNNPVPPTESVWGSFNILRDKNRKLLHRILDSAAALQNPVKGSTAQLIGDFYASGMDSAGIEKLGVKPLQPMLDKIGNIKDAKDVLDVIANLQRNGIFPLFGIMVDQDARKSDEYALYASQGGLGLPNKAYYLKKDGKSDTVRQEYIAHVSKMFQLMGEPAAQADKDANTVMKFETELADASMSPVELRDPIATYNKYTMAQVMEMTPAMDWKSYLASATIPEVPTMIISQPKFFKKVNDDLKSVSMDDWKVYLRWHLIHNTARFLSSDFVNESFNFYSMKLNGVKVIEPRWKRIQSMTDMALGDALGQEYVKVAFSAEAKKKVVEMIHNLVAALRERINGLDWMSATTKVAANEKLNTLMVKIGYPDKWKSYAGLNIDRNSYVVNVMRSDSFEYQRNIHKLGKPVDRTEWGMTPPTINAYYNPSLNEIVFPAGILQPPFYDPNADDAVNYGGIGAVIGHELTHGFDDQGRLYDAKGDLKNWWTKEDSANFMKRAQVIVHQFNHYSVDGLHINGELTEGENLADLGGLTIAYVAFKKAEEGKPDPGLIDGYTPDQRFFLGWAYVWRSNERPEALRQQILTNPHSPSLFRVNGPLSNNEAFYKAFNVQPGDSMMAPDSLRAKIW